MLGKKFFAFLLVILLVVGIAGCDTKEGLDCKLCNELTGFAPTNRDVEWLGFFPESKDIPNEDDLQTVSVFRVKNGGSVRLVNIADKEATPNIAIISVNPTISRSLSPLSTIQSPLELYTYVAEEPQSPPEILERHHAALASANIVPQRPRTIGGPLQDPGEPEFGEVDSLCENWSSNQQNGWAWFSMGHGVINRSANAKLLWTDWSVVTGGASQVRSAAVCLLAPGSNNDSDPRARYRIYNKQDEGSWDLIFSSSWLGIDQGVGFQTYGPGEGRTRIVIETENDTQLFFRVGASWGDPGDWYLSS